MAEKILHITNGDGLTENLQQLKIDGDIVVWREMLSEGPTVPEVGSAEFIKVRKNYLKATYGITAAEYQEKFLKEFEKLKDTSEYREIVLWFEFDLFSHMNMLALISSLMQGEKNIPFYLVCSGRLKGEIELQPLSELPIKDLEKHYKCKIELNRDDLEIATLIWELYCGDKPKRLISEIKKTSNFEYLSSCIRAHIERFPNARSGLNTLESNVLKLIQEHEISSLNQLLGYALKYQGYYGYGDIQMQRVLDKLKTFYKSSRSQVSLNEAGMKALEGTENFYQKLKDDEYFGGVKKYDFLYDPESHNLLKL